MQGTAASKETGNSAVCRPFLKWAGGKGRLLPELVTRLPGSFNRYFEPFVGGGALFFKLQPENARLSDVNPELISAYLVVRDNVDALIRILKIHRYEKDYFYRIRNADRDKHINAWSDIERAGRLIYLNKTCFNGLFRVNSRGEFNVPFGRYTNPTICDSSNLKACSMALSSATLKVESFEYVLREAQRGDFVYFDPPYAPLTATANFTGYSRDGFDKKMQVQLRDVCGKLEKKGVNFMVSNSSAPLILDLYKNFRIEFVSAARAINSRADRRGRIQEVIVTNYR